MIGFRCGVVFMLLAGKESKACVEFAVMMADYTLEMQLKNFGPTLLKQFSKDFDEPDKYSPNHVIFHELPETFVLADLRALKGAGVKESSLYTIIRRWTNEGLIERRGKCWAKIKRQQGDRQN